MTEPPHDILAAEAFVVPAGDPELHPPGPLKLPDDPTGIVEPHDVLAAEEFAMPAPRPGGGRLPNARQRAGEHKGRIALLAGGLLAAVVLMGALRRFLRTL
jgi:hypothetical protein